MLHTKTLIHTQAFREHIELSLLTEMKRLYAAGTIDMPRMRAIARHTVAVIKTDASHAELVQGLGTYATEFPEMLSIIRSLLGEYEGEKQSKELAQAISTLRHATATMNTKSKKHSM
jgi:hypothetical protein